LTLEDDDVDGPLNQLLPKAKKETPDRIGTSYICTDAAAGIGSKVLFEEASVIDGAWIRHRGEDHQKGNARSWTGAAILV